MLHVLHSIYMRSRDDDKMHVTLVCTDLMLDSMVASGQLDPFFRDKIQDMLLMKHRHQHQRHQKRDGKGLPMIRSLADIGRKMSASRNLGDTKGEMSEDTTCGGLGCGQITTSNQVQRNRRVNVSVKVDRICGKCKFLGEIERVKELWTTEC